MNTKKSGGRKPSFTIVVGIDYTPAGEAALAEAIRLAADREDTRLHVVHGLDVALRGTTTGKLGKLETVLDKGTAKLKAHLERVRKSPLLASRDLVAHVRVSAPADAIVQVAVDVDADLVVVGTTPRKGIAKLVHSSVSSKVLKHAACAVLLVRRKNHAGMARTPRIEPACTRCQAIRTMSGATSWWCERHAERAALRPHVYGYHRALSLRSAVPPGGT